MYFKSGTVNKSLLFYPYYLIPTLFFLILHLVSIARYKAFIVEKVTIFKPQHIDINWCLKKINSVNLLKVQIDTITVVAKRGWKHSV